MPYPMVAALLFAVPALGASRAALREWIAIIAGKERADGRVMGDTSKAQLAPARSSADIEAARHLLEASARWADHAPVTALSVAENQRDATAAVACARRASIACSRPPGAAVWPSDLPCSGAGGM